MSLEEAFARVAADDAPGDLGRARDRLQGMVLGYPDELEVRRRLGDIFWRLQDWERAGRYWYLIESDRPEMDAAKKAFERRWGGSRILMLHAVAFRGSNESVRGTYAGDVLGGLGVDVERERKASLDAYESVIRRHEARGKVVTVAFIVMFFAVVVLAAIGLFTLLGLFQGALVH